MAGKKRNPNYIKTILILLIAVMIAATAFVIKLCLDLTVTQPKRLELPEFTKQSDSTIAPAPETSQPEIEASSSTASIGAMGDLLMHMPIFDDRIKYNAAVEQADGSYDFTSVFQYLTEYVSSLDYAAVNLETTLCGTENGFGYSGYPNFNCPDEVVDGVRDAGFDMLLTANNHSYDTTLVGFKRTLEVIRGRGMDTLGTYTSSNETKWMIQEINGIKIGMLCYTYATRVSEDGRPSLNDNQYISEAGLCNYFSYNNLEGFYGELQGHLEAMGAAGAEATVLFIHWGTEYELVENEIQKAMAQRLCDLGIDAIIGGHPHVVQPVELLTSREDPEHHTVCLYSLGNAVSNQRLGSISYVSTAHTEDGILFSVTFEKNPEGDVALSEVRGLPTWVNKHTNENGKDEYNILPLDLARSGEWKNLYGLSDATQAAAKASYDRTMQIIGSGIEEVNAFLARNR